MYNSTAPANFFNDSSISVMAANFVVSNLTRALLTNKTLVNSSSGKSTLPALVATNITSLTAKAIINNTSLLLNLSNRKNAVTSNKIQTSSKKYLSSILFPDFYDSDTYEPGKSMSREGKSSTSDDLDSNLFLDLLPSDDLDPSGANRAISTANDNNKTAVFLNDDYIVNDFAANYTLISDDEDSFYTQMSTPLFYILFMFLIYILIITVIFMSAIYSHRKRVGYNYEDIEDEEAVEDEDDPTKTVNIFKKKSSSDKLDIENELGDFDNEDNIFKSKQYQKLKGGMKSNDDLDSDSDYFANSCDEQETSKKSYLKNNRKNVSYIENVFKLLTDINTEPRKSSPSTSSSLSKKLSALRPRIVNTKKDKKDKLLASNKTTEDEKVLPQSNIFSTVNNFTKPLLDGNFFDEENL
jgi:hypothetical protein